MDTPTDIPSSPPRRRTRARIVRGALAATVLCLPAALPATVEEQRARLPPPAQCSDAVEGEWRAHKYDPRFDDWGIFTLLLRRQAPGSRVLVGRITTEYWTGGVRYQLPPPCFPGLRHYRVSQEAFGSLDGMRVDVAGRNLRLEEQHCPRSFNSYNLDHFSGVIDPARQEFQARNNDGGRDIDEPTVFRRVRCFEPETVPHPVVAPPAFVPPARRPQGCAR